MMNRELRKLAQDNFRTAKANYRFARNQLLHLLDRHRSRVEATSITPGSIAVFLHVFYEDLIPESVFFLQRIPFPFDLFVSTPHHHLKPKLERLLGRKFSRSQVTVRVVENRGRDIAAMLVYFREDLLKYDLLCRIHTKKSLFAKGMLEGWREHLLKGLLGSERIVLEILSRFAEDPQLGILYPQTFPKLSYWDHTWSVNRAIGERLLDRMGITDRPQTYFDFPAGSMFWARPKALGPLLTYDFQLEDFEPEAGQIDGTLAHAIERCFVIIANHRGYHHQVTRNRRPLGVDRIDPCEESIDFSRYDKRHFEDLFTEVDKPEITAVAIDLLDTLFLRPFPEVGTSPLLQPEMLRPREPLRAVVNHAVSKGKQVILLASDTFSRETWDWIVRRHGISNHQLLINPMEPTNEQSTVPAYPPIEQLGLEPSEILHIGDDAFADIKVPIHHNVRFFHLMPPGELLRRTKPGRRMLATKDSQAQSIVLGLCANRAYGQTFTRFFDANTIIRRDPHLLGYCCLGPLSFAFSRWLILSAQSDGIEELCFLAPMTRALLRAYELLAEAVPGAPAAHSRETSGSSRAIEEAELEAPPRQGGRTALVDLGFSGLHLEPPHKIPRSSVCAYTLVMSPPNGEALPTKALVDPPSCWVAPRPVQSGDRPFFEMLLDTTREDLRSERVPRGEAGLPDISGSDRDRRRQLIPLIHSGIADFTRDLVAHFGNDSINKEIPLDAALQIYRDFLSHPCLSSGMLLSGLAMRCKHNGNNVQYFLPEIGGDGYLKREQFRSSIWETYLSELGQESHEGKGRSSQS